MKTSHSIRRWRQVKEILGCALELKESERAQYLAEVCAEDFSLRSEVESLLAQEEDDDFFERASELNFSMADAGSRSGLEGRVIGAYKLIREIGAGGMGLVFLATRADNQFEQTFALKLLRRGLDTKTAVRRFETERQILAKLSHPNIACLLDGGATDDGIPFIVMEYVEGVPIDEYCEQRGLSLVERLELFRSVCSAVAYAHRNLIVHRDLKPDNILVTGDGTPKLLDFGIAKLLSSDEVKATVTRWQALTPDYASPEQICGSSITTASDVYNLGVVLYELLTGCRPFRFKSTQPEEIYRILAHDAPLRPSSARRDPPYQSTEEAGDGRQASEFSCLSSPLPFSPARLKGDLDNIILKALSREPERRYASVEQFSEDIRRYLVGLPVVARRGTFVYRAKKFVARNRLKVSAAVLIFLTLVGGIAATIDQNRIARLEREKAERRAENLRKISNALVVEIHDAIRNLPGSLPARRILLQRAVEQLDILAAEAGGDPRLLDELAIAQFNVGEMYQAIGDVVRSEEALRKAVEIYENLSASQPKNVHYRIQLAKGYVFLGNISYMRGEADKTLDYYSRAPQILELVSEANPGDTVIQEGLWDSYFNYSVALTRAGRAADSLKFSRRTLEISEVLLRADPSAGNRRKLYLSRLLRGTNQLYLGYYQEALSEYESVSWEIAAERAAHPNDSRYLYDSWALERRRAQGSALAGDLSASVRHFRTAIEIIEELADKNPTDAGYRRNASVTYLAYGEMLADAGKFSEAESLFERAAKLSEKLNAEDARNGETVGDLAQIYAALGRTLARTGRVAEALRLQKKSLAFFDTAGVKNALLERNLAAAAEQTAETLFLLADEDKEEAYRHRSEAKSLLENSFRLWQNLKEKDALAFADRDRAAKIAGKLKDLEEQ